MRLLLRRKKKKATPVSQALGIASKVFRALAAVRIARTTLKGVRWVRRLPVIAGVIAAGALLARKAFGGGGGDAVPAYTPPPPPPTGAPPSPVATAATGTSPAEVGVDLPDKVANIGSAEAVPEGAEGFAGAAEGAPRDQTQDAGGGETVSEEDVGGPPNQSAQSEVPSPEEAGLDAPGEK
jgi:hypothetical protein